MSQSETSRAPLSRTEGTVEQYSINDALLIREMPEGTKVKLRNGAIAEVTANPRDGGWIFVRYLEWAQNPDKVSSDELAFCTDVIGVALQDAS